MMLRRTARWRNQTSKPIEAYFCLAFGRSRSYYATTSMLIANLRSISRSTHPCLSIDPILHNV